MAGAALAGTQAGDDAVFLAPQEAMTQETGAANIRYAANMSLPLGARFLTQAAMGASMVDIEQVATRGITGWVNDQMLLPQTLHRSHVNGTLASLAAGSRGGEDQFYESFWKQVCTGQDQLRQRTAFALSQIFVVSFQDDTLAVNGRGMASFYDVLGKHAFGNFRDLMQDIATHPMMGIYLTYLRNKKETATTVPDENFARELMQLMTIGLYQLNQDGTPKLSGGKPIETYDRDDVAGLAKVLTGWSWAGADRSDSRFYGQVADPDRDWKPMQNYPQFHSTSAKQVLGQSLPAGTGEAELKAALDRLFNHPNVGPFIGRQLIQHMVTSNPSPAYVARVAAAFNNNGYGQRGDMRAVVRAILYDSDARSAAGGRTGGRVREPVLRMANWMRAFYASSTSGSYRMWQLDDPLTGLGQTVLRAPSVFNFYRPGYTPPGTQVAALGLVAPEMQITSEPSVTGWLNVMQNVVEVGIGKGLDIKPNYARELALVAKPDDLVNRIDLLLTAGQMSTTLRGQIRRALDSIPLVAVETPANQAAADYQKTHRVYLAVFLALASPEFIVQQ